MNAKRANWLFLVIVVSHAGLSLLASYTHLLDVVLENIVLNIILSEITIWLPAVLFLLATGTRPAVFCRLRRVHISTALMTVLFTLLMEPLVTVVNALSLLVTDNVVAGMSGQVVGMPLWGMLLGIAVYGPFSEELAFRGAIYQSYRQQGSGLKAILLSSLLFGLMHMNLNQAGYAFVMGIALALLVEATGSMIPAFIAHFCVNGLSTVLLYAMNGLTSGAMEELVAEAESSLGAQEIWLTISVYVFLATFCTPLAGCVLAWIAGREGHKEDMKALWRSRREKSGSLLSIPLVLGILVCAAVIILQLVL